MKDPGIVGIGCYAKPETLSRVLKKWVEHYVLGNFEGLVRDNGEKFVPPDVIDLKQYVS